MKTKYFILAALAGLTLASCSSDEFLGDNSPNVIEETTDNGAIRFGFELPNATRADIAGPAAAELLGSNFYVTGTKGDEQDDSPTTGLVFDNYLVHYTANTAGTTESNTANWEYVGVVPGTTTGCEDYVQLGDYQTGTGHAGQTIKYWDYSAAQYDFLAFSTGTKKAVSGTSSAADEIGVTKMAYGAALASSGVAYTFDIPNVACLENTFISDITEVEKTAYGKDVTLKFKNLGSKVRVALYETVPGYSVKDVVFYTEDGTTDFSDDKDTPAALISTGLPNGGKIKVYFPHVGNNNDTEEDYDKAAATVDPATITATVTYKEFDDLDNFQGPDKDEADDDYLGRNLTEATFAGSADANYYKTVFPVSTSAPLTLRVDYTLVSVDGSGEEITVLGAKAVVPSTYTKWLPNYAYTYIFKISDNTNGWTDPAGVVSGLFPITFDAVVTEATDVTGEQTTITTVATPSITTYQQGHDYSATDEYSKSGNKLYVQVMNGTTLVDDLDEDTDDDTNRSLLYLVSDDDATEALVMDALEKRTTEIDVDASVKGRNSITLTKQASPIINNSVTSIVNGVDDNPITVDEGTAAEINIASLTATKTYAYVYDYTSGNKNVVIEYQPIDVSGGTVGSAGKSYKSLAISTLETWDDIETNPSSTHYSIAGAVDNDYIYFSITTNGTGDTTYSYYSVAGKTTVPAGLLKYPKASISTSVTGGTATTANTIYFDVYNSNDGEYAVKVIKIVG